MAHPKHPTHPHLDGAMWVDPTDMPPQAMTSFFNCSLCQLFPCVCHAAAAPGAGVADVVHVMQMGAGITAPPLSDADVDRIAKRVVEMLRAEWDKERRDTAFVGTIDEFAAHIEALDQIDEHGVRHDEGEG